MGTVFCVGRNYAEHAREMGAEAGPLVVFLKPERAVTTGRGIRLPAGAGEVHHEAEVVVRVGADGECEAVALGLDLTDRTRQQAAKAAGLPWAEAKGFRGAAPLGPFVPVSRAPPLGGIRFLLRVNGEVRQRGDTASMLRPVPELLRAIDAWYGLSPGDLVFTGTPAGVGPLRDGDALELEMEGCPEARVGFVVERAR
jgi:2-keto-4-pentenoate hydratase/2-oxohepta-3-ene-1,7-dioic acid hydratase in catechol pathway